MGQSQSRSTGKGSQHRNFTQRSWVEDTRARNASGEKSSTQAQILENLIEPDERFAPTGRNIWKR